MRCRPPIKAQDGPDRGQLSYVGVRAGSVCCRFLDRRAQDRKGAFVVLGALKATLR